MKNLKTPIRNSLLLSCILFSFFQLNAQSFYNTFDRAQSLGEGISEISGNFAHQAISYDGETEGFTNTFGLRAGYGFKGGFDLKFSWTTQRYKEGSSTIGNFFVLKPKYSMDNGKFAIALPFGVVTQPSNSENNTYISPEILFNHPFSQKFKFGTNARLVIPFDEYSSGTIQKNQV